MCHSFVAAVVPVHATPKLDLLLRVPYSATTLILWESLINLDYCRAYLCRLEPK
jgi:hypothetical protein